MTISVSHCMHGMTNRRTMFVRNKHASEHALDRIVHSHTSFENTKRQTAAQRIGDKYACEKRQPASEAYKTA